MIHGMVAALDGAAVGLPMDLVIGGYVAQNHARLLLYVLMGAAGSALGSLVVYAIGYAGGEELLRKRVTPERFEKLHEAFEKHPFWSLMFPVMLPPPTPFKLFVLSAGVAEMRFSEFLGAIFSGRFLRFSLLSLIVVRYGPEILGLIGSVVHHHLRYLIAAVAAAALAGWWIWRIRKLRAGRRSSELARKS